MCGKKWESKAANIDVPNMAQRAPHTWHYLSSAAMSLKVWFPLAASSFRLGKTVEWNSHSILGEKCRKNCFKSGRNGGLVKTNKFIKKGDLQIHQSFVSFFPALFWTLQVFPVQNQWRSGTSKWHITASTRSCFWRPNKKSKASRIKNCSKHKMTWNKI